MHTNPWRHGAVALACALFGSAALAANERIQLAYKSPDILGTSTLKGYEGTIDVSSVQWGMGVGVSSGSTLEDRSVTAPSISDITWTQGFDRSYVGLGKALSQPGNGSSKFSFLTSTGAGFDSYLTVETQRSSLTGLSFVAGGGQPSVSASETFDILKLTFKPELLAGQRSTSAPVVVSYDARTNIVSGTTGRSTSLQGGTSSSGLYLQLGSAAGDVPIKGDGSLRGYEGWVALDSAQMGVGVAISQAGGRVTAVPSFSELTLTQHLDGAVPAMLANLLKGRNIGEAKLVYLESVRDTVRVVTQVRMANVVFSGMAFSSGGDVPVVSESLNFTGYEQTVWDYSGGTPRQSSFTMGWMGGVGALPAEASGGMAPGPAPLPVPEPGSWALMLGGMAWLLGRRRGLGG